MKRRLLIFLTMVTIGLTGCSQADRVAYNVSKEADNFNQVRQLTVINCFTDTVLFQMTGKMSFEVDEIDDELEIVVEDENGKYKKHFVGLPDNVTYVVEDITSDEVSNVKYTLNFNPDMILPYEVSTIE